MFATGKTIAKKYIDRSKMEFVEFTSKYAIYSGNLEDLKSVVVLPNKTNIATIERERGTPYDLVKIYNLNFLERPTIINIFHESET